jgi:excisionase family DNA binding protein
MEATAPPVMTIAEVAEYLRIPRASVYKLAQQGRIPCQKVGRHWRFRREALDRWLEEREAGEKDPQRLPRVSRQV